MPDLLISMNLKGVSGLPEDVFVNSFCFADVPNTTTATLDSVAGAVIDFYNVQAPGALMPLGALLSPAISRSSIHDVDVYDITGHLDGSPHGSPIKSYTGVDLADSSNATGLPSEVAYVLTLEGGGRAAAPVEGPDGPDAGGAIDRPKQRRTGRLYLGPLNLGCLTMVGNIPRPSTDIRDTSRLAADRLQSQVFLATGVAAWAVWSRANAATYPLEAVSNDDAFDTQRRRGEAPTLRTRTVHV